MRGENHRSAAHLPLIGRLDVRCSLRRCLDAFRGENFASVLPVSPSSVVSLPINLAPTQEQHFTTRAQHLEDVQNMSGSARTRRHSTRVGKHRPPLALQKSPDTEEGIYLTRF